MTEKTGIVDGLNDEQRAAVQHGEGPTIIIAGAGTGKTTVITRRIAWLIQEKKLKTDEILALTFTEKAAQEMEERVEALLPYGFTELWISTFHGFCERILKAHALDIGLPSPFKFYTEFEQYMMLRRHIEDLDLNYYKPLGNPTKFLDALIHHFSRAKDENISPAEYFTFAEQAEANTDAKDSAPENGEDGIISEASRLKELASAYNQYDRFLREEGALDFGDLIVQTLRLFKKRPHILKQYQKQFKYILVDEFQDTNYAQYELVKLLAAPKNNITIVADDDQSIYKFRGASVSNVLKFKNSYEQTKQISLIKNYRSKQNILSLAHNFIQNNNPDRLEVKMNINKKLENSREGEGIIEYWRAPTQEAEVRAIIKKILDLRSQNKELIWSDFAVLVRTNGNADIFLKFFETANIPYQFVASKGLYTQPEILDIIAYLKLLDNYHESKSAYRLLIAKIFHIPFEDIATLLEEAAKQGKSLYQIMRNIETNSNMSADGKQGILRLVNLCKQGSDMMRERRTIGNTLLNFLEASGMLKEFTKLPEEKARQKIEMIAKFFKDVESFERSGGGDATLQAFLEHVRFMMDSGDTGAMGDEIDTGPDAVKIMTAHKSKGLEFAYVFVTQLVDKRFPLIERKDAIPLSDGLIKEILPSGNAHLEEERRLFYVAITRARDGIFFTGAEDYGGKKKKKPSRFLHEAGLIDAVKPVETEMLPKTEKTPEKANEEKLNTPISLPKNFSYTQLKDYDLCPYKYRFAYMLKVPTKNSEASSFGKSIHATLQEFFTQFITRRDSEQVSLFGNMSEEKKIEKNVPELKELLDAYERNWIQEWYASEKRAEERKKAGREMLKKFYEQHLDNWPKVLFLEKGFHLRLGEYSLKGYIDRVDDIDDNAVEILDYKTGNTPKKPKKANEQLMIYALAARDILEKKPVAVSFYYIESNTKHTFEVTPEKLEKVETWIGETIRSIRQGNFTATPGRHCEWCDFREICDFRKV